MRSVKRFVTVLVVLAGAVGGAVGASGGAQAARHPAAATAAAAGQRLPCDIYGSAGTPCVAAYSTIRVLRSGYDGPLYEVTRASDGRSLNIRPARPGGFADAAAQNAFCAGTSCVIAEIYDQSRQHNNLTIEGAGAQAPADKGAVANALPLVVDGHQVYGVKITEGTGYRDDSTSGVATRGQPESMYMVTSGTYVNSGCCFDFGNAETNNADNGNGHMDAVNFGTRCVRFSPCYGDGPWVQADLENGLFQSNMGYSEDPSDTGLTAPFVTAMLENNGQDYFALKVGDARSSLLTTTFSGALPTIQGGGYSPMQQEGAIVLGTGGDNSNTGEGYFFEGAMTAGVPSNRTVNTVQASIAHARYGRA